MYFHSHGLERGPVPQGSLRVDGNAELFHPEKRLRPYIAGRDHCKFGWWHSGSCVAQPSTGFLNGRFQPDGSPTEDTEDCLGRITVGLTRSKIAHPGSLPIRHDGPHRYGTSTCYAGLWCARPSTRSHHVGLAFLQSESGTRKQQPNGKMVPQCGTFVVIPSSSHCQPIS